MQDFFHKQCNPTSNLFFLPRSCPPFSWFSWIFGGLVTVFVKTPEIERIDTKNGPYLKPEPPFRRPIILDIQRHGHELGGFSTFSNGGMFPRPEGLDLLAGGGNSYGKTMNLAGWGMIFGCSTRYHQSSPEKCYFRWTRELGRVIYGPL